jgi:hypothetical protein
VTERYFTITPELDATPVVTRVTLSADLVAPQPVNTTITFTATPTGGVAPHQYQFLVFDTGVWTSSPWTTSNTFRWTPTVGRPNYRIAVRVRSAGNTGAYEAATEVNFAISKR